MENNGFTMRDKHTTKKLLLTITTAVIVLVGAGTATVALRLHDNAATPAPVHSAQKAAVRPQPATTISYSGQEGKSALALLKQHATITTKDSSYGPYVDSVNGVAGGTSGKYWTFYVNGAQASVGADAYVTHSTDKIVWKFE
jgi:hypothetical protein